jgi:hypothetical protein
MCSACCGIPSPRNAQHHKFICSYTIIKISKSSSPFLFHRCLLDIDVNNTRTARICHHPAMQRQIISLQRNPRNLPHHPTHNGIIHCHLLSSRCIIFIPISEKQEKPLHSRYPQLARSGLETLGSDDCVNVSAEYCDMRIWDLCVGEGSGIRESEGV